MVRVFEEPSLAVCHGVHFGFGVEGLGFRVDLPGLCMALHSTLNLNCLNLKTQTLVWDIFRWVVTVIGAL